jgi:hypothetical protein
MAMENSVRLFAAKQRNVPVRKSLAMFARKKLTNLVRRLRAPKAACSSAARAARQNGEIHTFQKKSTLIIKPAATPTEQ